MRARIALRFFVGLAGFAAAPLLGCSSEGKASPPTAGTYTIDFGSTAAAVASDTVQTFFFDASDGGTQCFTLVQKRKSHAEMPPTLVDPGAPVPICNIVNGTTPDANVIPYGTVAILVVAQKGGTDFLIGCAIKQVTQQSDAPVVVSLTPASSTQAVPPTSCQKLSDHCSASPCK